MKSRFIAAAAVSLFAAGTVSAAEIKVLASGATEEIINEMDTKSQLHLQARPISRSV